MTTYYGDAYLTRSSRPPRPAGEVYNPRSPLRGPGVLLYNASLEHFMSPRFERGLSYATNGHVTDLGLTSSVILARVYGSDDAYEVSLHFTTPDFSDLYADCDCPYGSRAGNWCKHAIALSYVAAARLSDTAPSALPDFFTPLVPAPPSPPQVQSDPNAPTRLSQLTDRLRVPARPSKARKKTLALALRTLPASDEVRQALAI